MNEIMMINKEEIRITSIELVEIINEFRKLEREKLGESKLTKPIRHDNFMNKIRKEIIKFFLNKKGVTQMSNIYNEDSIQSLSPRDFTRLRPRRLCR